MTFLMIILAIGLLLVGAGAMAGAATAMRREERTIQRRVDTMLVGPSGAEAKKPEAAWHPTSRIRTILSLGVSQSWKSKTSDFVLIALAAAGGLIVGGVLALVFHLPWPPCVVGAIVGVFAPPQFLLRFEQARLEAKFVEAFPDAIDMIVRMLRAGLPMSAAIRIVGQEAASPVKEVFASVSDQMTIGINFDQALIAEGRRVRAQDFRFFTVAASLQQSTGGNLAATLEILSAIVRKRRAARLKASAVTAEVRMSAYVLAAIPFLVIGGLMVIKPDYLVPLIVDKRGHVIVAIAAASLITGFAVMRQMMRSVTRI